MLDIDEGASVAFQPDLAVNPDDGKRMRLTSPKVSQRIVLPALALLAAFATGCGGAGGYCEAAAECERGNDSDIQACQIKFDEAADEADLKNCTSEYDDFFNCLEEAARCNNDEYKASDGQCGDEEQRWAKCVN